MKGFALVLLCALVAVQARHTSIARDDDTELAQYAPWIVHLRVAVSTSGLLNTGVANLIHPNWALTASSAIDDARFIWARFGVKDVISPQLVYELGVATTNLHPGYNAATNANNIGLLQIARGADEAGISSVSLPLPGAALASSAVFCGFGDNDGAPGTTLVCSRVALTEGDDNSVTVDIVGSAKNDVGAGVVADDTIVAILSGEDEYISTAAYLDWIESTTGVSSSRRDVLAEDSDAFRVNFVDN